MENDFDCTYNVTLTIHTDADPSDLLCQAIELAKSLADRCDGVADEGDVMVTAVQLDKS